LLHIAGDAVRHRDAPNRGLRARVSVGVGPELAEVPGRPALVAQSLALAVPQGLEAALRLGNGPAAPCWDARVIGSVSGAGGTARDQSERAEPLYQRRPATVIRPSGLRERDVGRSLVFAACRVRERHLELTGIGRSEGEREVLVDDFTLDGILSRTFPPFFRKSGTAHATGRWRENDRPA